MSTEKGLALFQENFCLAFIHSDNASAAYRAVSPKSRLWSSNALWVTASKMMARPNVDLRISQLRAGMARRAIASAESLADELEQVIELAKRKKQCGVVVTAIMFKAKLFGLLPHKKETCTGYLDDLDPDQLRLIHDLIATTITSGEYPLPADPDENAHAGFGGSNPAA